MFKKLLVTCIALVSTISVVFALNREMQAASGTEYYATNEAFKHTNKTKFQMGGLNWWILYADQSGNGYIMADSVSNTTYCKTGSLEPAFSNTVAFKSGVNDCLTGAQNVYNTGNNDDIGEIVKNSNSSITNLRVPSLEDYLEITKNEENAEKFVSPSGTGVANYIWLNELTNGSRLTFVDINYTPASKYNSYKHIHQESENSLAAKVNPVFKIALPQSNQLDGITYTQTNATYTYNDTAVLQGGKVADIEAVKGEGNYSIDTLSGVTVIGDVDEVGKSVVTGKLLSEQFVIANADTVTGTAELIANEKIDAGDYYVKIKIKDNSTNQRLYVDVDDALRTKTIVVKVTVKKADQDALKIYDDADMKNEVITLTKDASDQHTPFTLYTGGGSDEIADSSIKYTIKSGSNIIKSIDPSSASSKVELTGTSGTAVITVKKEGGDNFNDVTQDISIVVQGSMSITYTPQYPTGATVANTYEYSKNVKGNDIIGEVTFSNGTSPYSLELLEDKDGSEDYKNFSLSATKDITSGVDVSINPNGPNINADTGSLEVKTGGYKFCVAGLDANNKPVDANGDSSAKQCVTVNINKTTPTLSYTTTTKTDMMIGSTNYIDTIKTSNGDLKLTTLAVPDFKLTGGTPSVLTVKNSTTNVKGFEFEVVPNYTGTNLPATFKLETTLPETTNYKAVTTAIKKDVFVYKELSALTWSGKTSYSTTDVVSGKEVGTLKAVDGVANYVYSLTTSADAGIKGYEAADAVDNTYFIVDPTPTAAGKTMSVKTASNLIEKDGGYKIQFKVKDDKGNIAFQKAIINVSAKTQDPINFRDKTGGSIITKKTMKLDSTSDSVFADGGSTSISMEYTIAPDNEQTGGIKGSDYLSVDKANGDLTAKKVGTVVIIATRPGNATYGSISKKIDLVIEPAERTIAFGNVDDPRNIKIGSTDLNEVALQSKVVSTDTITYSSDDPTVVDIDASGNLTIGIVGSATIKAEVVDSDGNYETVSCEKDIQVFDGMSGTFKQGIILQAGNTATTGKTVGSLSVQGGQTTPTYKISTESGSKNVDAGLFNIDSAYGTLSLKSNVLASDLSGKYDTGKKAYVLKAQVDVFDGTSKSTTVDCEVTMKGANLSSVSFANADGTATSKLTYSYSDGGTFNLGLTGNSGNGLPIYRLKDDASMPSDVIGPVMGNTITILNANDPASNPKPVKVEAVIPASGGYDEKTIECVVEITKAEQNEFKFAKELIEIYPEGSISPEFIGKMSDGPLTLTSNDQSIVSIEGNTIKATKKEGSTTVKAIWKGNRNYKDGVTTGNVSVTNAPAYAFEIRVPSFTYGDVNANADITSNGATAGATLIQKWSSSDETIASIDEQTGEITVISAGYSTITCVQTSDKDSEVRASIQLYVKPKPITLKYQDITMYTGETMQEFAMEANASSGSLVGDDTMSIFVMPANTTSTAPNNISKGSYVIKGSYTTAEANLQGIKNYEVTILEGALQIEQDTPIESWLSAIDETKWSKEDVVLQSTNPIAVAGTYTQISIDKGMWNPSVTISSEGIHPVDLWFRVDSGTHIGAISDKISKTVKVDKTKPIIKSITGEQVNTDATARFMNAVTFGTMFKPGVEVEIMCEDPITNAPKVSGLKEVRYKIYEVDTTGINHSTPIDEGSEAVDASGKLLLPRLDAGSYEIQAIVVDHAGNESELKASRLLVKSWGESSDGDELSDINIDVNNDGIAEINITRPGEKKPYLNIDTTGDGLPDINISRDGEKVEAGVTQPYLNIIHPETPWNPTAKIDYDEDGTPDFRTDESLEAILSLDSNEDGIPDLNIDTDGDYIPNLNIDVNNDKKTPETNIDAKGEGVASINIDSNGDGTPELFIATGYAWDPKDEVKSNGKTIYATVIGIKPDSKDSLVDGGVIVKPSDPNTSFLPNYALKVNDVTESITEQEKDMIVSNSGSKNGEVKIVFDVNLLEDNKVIQPNGKIQVSIPIDKTIKNPRLMMKGEDGTWNFIEAEEKDGYYVFDTDYIGSVSIIGDKEEVVKEDPIETPPSSKQDDNSSTSVKGNYMNGMGGAGTGDISNICLFIWTGGGSIMILGYIIMKFIKAPSVKK